jgi:ParB-like nuclease domain
MAVRKLDTKETLVKEWLDENSVHYVLEREFPLSKIDFNTSLQNQARLSSPLNEDVVQNYAEAIEGGAVFPPCVGYMKGSKLVFIDGNHRGQAYLLLGAETMPVYVLKNANTDVILKMTYEANATHGVPNSPEERLEHAMWLVRSGHTQQSAAVVMNVRVADLRTALQRSDADRRAASLNIKRVNWTWISVSARTRINAIKSDQVFRKTVEVVNKLGLKSGAVSELVSNINEAKTNAAQMKILDNYLKQNEDKIQVANKGKRNRRYLVRTHALGLITDLDREDFFQNLPPQEAQEYKALLSKVVKRTNQAVKELAAYE